MAGTEDPWHVSVLIPARNEELLLPRCLRSVLDALDQLAPSITTEVVVAVDCSTDRTYDIAHSLLGERGRVICTHAGVVGKARAVAARTALKHLQRPLNRSWLANTDADCSVPLHWLRDQLFVAACGVEAIAGTVDVDCFDEHDAGVPQRFRDTYLVRADGTHPHVHGANLGVRADAYLRAGGWHPLSTAEDHDLWHRLGSTGALRRSIAPIQVTTSGRRVGRAPLGFADALAAHNEQAA